MGGVETGAWQHVIDLIYLVRLSQLLLCLDTPLRALFNAGPVQKLALFGRSSEIAKLRSMYAASRTMVGMK